MVHICEFCGVIYTQKTNLNRHKKLKHNNESNLVFTCELCDRTFTRNEDLKRHINNIHLDVKHTCEVCGKTYNRADTLLHHKNTTHEAPPLKRKKLEQYDNTPVNEAAGPSTSQWSTQMDQIPGPSFDQSAGSSTSKRSTPTEEVPKPLFLQLNTQPDLTSGPSSSNQMTSTQTEEVFTTVQTAFKNRVKTYSAQKYLSGDIVTVLNKIKPHIVQKLTNDVTEQQAIKFNLMLACKFKNVKSNEKVYNFKTKNEAVYVGSDIEVLVSRHVLKLV